MLSSSPRIAFTSHFVWTSDERRNAATPHDGATEIDNSQSNPAASYTGPDDGKPLGDDRGREASAGFGATSRPNAPTFIGWPMLMGLRLLALIGICLSGWNLWGEFFPTSAIASQPLQFDPPTIELGEIVQGDSVEHVVTLKNTSDQSIKILEVLPTCTCTTTGPIPDQIAPHSSSSIKIRYAFGDSRGDRTTVFRIVYRTDPPEKLGAVLEATVRARGTILPHYDVVPGRIEFTVGTPHKAQVELKERLGERVTIVAAYATRAWTVTNVSDDRMSLEVTYDGTTAIDRIAGASIRIETSSGRQRHFEIPVVFPSTPTTTASTISH